jgi:tetratricopeptide (TPR) repeat protein
LIASGCAEYERARAAAQAALDAGRLEEARQCLVLALQAARAHGDCDLVDHAVCAESAVAIALGEVEGPLPPLREILIRNRSHENYILAAYNIARAYELRKDYKKSLFYARIARDRADQTDNRKRLAAAHNQVGNALLGESHFDEAAESYRRALALLTTHAGEWELACTANLGYCDLVRGRRRDGLRRLYRVLRESRRRGLLRLEMTTRLDLCYGHMEVGRYPTAERYGCRGLALAEQVGEVDWIKNALYLLGQVSVFLGRRDEARRRFVELQRRFYPTQPYLPDLLVGVDVRQMINLRA